MADDLASSVFFLLKTVERHEEAISELYGKVNNNNLAQSLALKEVQVKMGLIGWVAGAIGGLITSVVLALLLHLLKL